MTKINDVLKARASAILRDFQDRHDLHGIVEVTSSKFSHVLIGTYEDRDGAWRARIQPAHLYDARFKAGTFSLSFDQLDALIEALSEVRDALSDRPSNRVKVVQKRKVAPASRQASAVTQAPAPAPAEDQVLAAVERLAHGLEAVVGRLEALEASLPQKDEEAKLEAEWIQAIEWQVKHSEAPYDCPVCGRSYKTRGRYLSHVAEAHGIAVEL